MFAIGIVIISTNSLLIIDFIYLVCSHGGNIKIFFILIARCTLTTFKEKLYYLLRKARNKSLFLNTKCNDICNSNYFQYLSDIVLIELIHI